MKKIIVFGASGDLAKAKIMPAISKINNKNIKVFAYARSDMKKSYARVLREAFEYIDNFPESIEYIQGQYDNLDPLTHIIDKETIIYLSLPPEVYSTVLSQLVRFEVLAVCVEKPYGVCYKSFQELMQYQKETTLFIDHYLLKPMIKVFHKLQNFNHLLFSLLDKHYIEHVECLFLEEILANSRAYFDKTGIIRDVMQNHLTEILATVLCDKPSLNFSKQRLELIKQMKLKQDDCVFGQYKSYCKEMSDVNESKKCSLTETFAGYCLSIDNTKWKNVPILMIAGKAMNRKATEVVFHVKKSRFMDLCNFFTYDILEAAQEMKIIFNISPLNEIKIEAVSKNTTDINIVIGAKQIEEECPGDYECLFNCLIESKYVPTISFEEADALWRIYQDLIVKEKKLFYYDEHIDMPFEAVHFIKRNK